MKKNNSAPGLGNAFVLAAGLAMGTMGLIANDCRRSEEKIEVGKRVSELEAKNFELDRDTSRVVRGLYSGNPAAKTIILSCKEAYKLCLDKADLSDGCNMEGPVDMCQPASDAGFLTMDELHCCHQIRAVENSCKAAYAQCLVDSKTTQL